MATRDVGVLVSILSQAEESVWANVEQSLVTLRPRWSSFAIDCWDRPASSSALNVRQAVHSRHAKLLAHFSRVLFLDTASRRNTPVHIRSSYSYRLHWNAAFGDVVARGPFGWHSEGVPQLLIGLDADIHVPERLPLELIAQALEIASADEDTSFGGPSDGAHGGHANTTMGATERAARDVWVHGRKPPCVKPPPRQRKPSLQPRKRPHGGLGEVGGVSGDSANVRVTPSGQVCALVSAADRPVWVAPRNLRRLREERDRSYLEMQHHFNGQNMGFCCGRQNVAAAPRWRELTAASVVTLSRGPWCPPSNFFILHRRSLTRMLATLRLWQQAVDRAALFKDKRLYRWEYTSCSLLGPGEAVLLAYYNMSEIDPPMTARDTRAGTSVLLAAVPVQRGRRSVARKRNDTDYWAI